MQQDPESNLRAAEQVAGRLARHGAPALVIGAVALAAHGYVRHTADIDLGADADVRTLRALADELRDDGFEVVLHEPDGQDPLGGVIDVSGPFGLVQVVSFADRFPAVIRDGLAAAKVRVRPQSDLLVAPLAHLVAMKLYAGGLKSKADILEVLRRNPDVDLDSIRATCRNYRLKGFDEILAELESA